jgi:hypothetical protein
MQRVTPMTALRACSLLLSLLTLPARTQAADAPGLTLLPTTTRLIGPTAQQRLLLERTTGTLGIEDLTPNASFHSETPAIVQVDKYGTVRPIANGLGIITATVGGQVARASFSVEQQETREPRSFRNEVQPVLTKFGCNSGACHGAAAGKNGFRLSLRAYAPEVDFSVISRQSLGRRVVKTAPEQSLILLKPTGAIEHAGGIRFGVDSLEYRVIAEWIAGGMPAPSAADPEVQSLKVYPPAVQLAPGQSQQILVQAVDSNGRIEDVTHWSKFASTDDSVATIDDSGKLKVTGQGEAAVSVWFSSHVATMTVTSPYKNVIDPQLFAKAPRNNPIDDHNLKKLALLHIPPSPDAGDRAFIRRAYLDTTGTLPPAEAVEPFVNDPNPNKRAKLIDQLLDSPEYVDYWSYKWCDLFLVSSAKLSVPSMWTFYRFVRENVKRNTPWHQIARSIITAQGSTHANGAANFFVLHRDPTDLTESVSMAFLGLSMTCARCHNHPLEKWTQDQYYELANLFGRVELKDGRDKGEEIVATALQGEINHPRRGTPLAPRPLDAPPVAAEDPRDRRVILADWFAQPDNPYFAKAVVNRVWNNFLGRGLIHPDDDLRASNPPSDGPLLDWLVADFQAHGDDLKHLMRTILNSATYARSSTPVPGNESDTRFLSHYRVKRLPAEVLLDGFSRVTEVPSTFPGYPAGWRSLQLPDNKVASDFLDNFGRPARINTCSCERSEEPSIIQAIHLSNGTTINEKLRSDQSIVARAIARGDRDEVIIDRLFLSALARHPGADESNRILKALSIATAEISKPDDVKATRRQSIEDLYWAVLTSREFLFNH